MNFRAHIRAFTNGSVKPNSGTSTAAFCCQSLKLEEAVRLNLQVTSKSVELCDISLGLLLRHRQPAKIVILTDSPSAVLLLGDLSTYNLLTRAVTGWNIFLQWIIVPISIQGNERTDGLASTAYEEESPNSFCGGLLRQRNS